MKCFLWFVIVGMWAFLAGCADDAANGRPSRFDINAVDMGVDSGLDMSVDLAGDMSADQLSDMKDMVALCEADQFVKANQCVPCPDGTANAGGDDPTGQDTMCDDACSPIFGVTCAAVESTYVKASNTGELDLFGFSVAISGDTMVVGAPGEGSGSTGIDAHQMNNLKPGSGAVYVFVRENNVWTQQAYLKASNSDRDDAFGISVAISGDTIVVGASFESSPAKGVNGKQLDNSAMRSGAAYVFVRQRGTWTQQAYLKASNTQIADSFGRSVAISGDTAVVGAHYEGSVAVGVDGDQVSRFAGNSGAAYVFVRRDGQWTQQAYVKASNTNAEDTFGHAMAIDGDTLVIGAPGEDSHATGVDGEQMDNSVRDSGAAYVFERQNGQWSQSAYLKASQVGAGDRFGISVAIDGGTIVVGADREDGAGGDPMERAVQNSGAAYVFVRQGDAWTQQSYLKASNAESDDHFGHAVAVSGDVIVVGAMGEASDAIGVGGDQLDNSVQNSGAAYVFARQGDGWAQAAYMKATNPGELDHFGCAVAVSGGTVVVGAMNEASHTTGIGGYQENNDVRDSGAVYVYPK